MKASLRRLLLVAALSLLAGTLPAKTLNVLLLANASTQDVIQKLVREYQQQNPDTDFNVSIVQSNSITAKLNTLVTAGQPPDIVEITTAFIQNYAAQALDLGKYTNSQELLQRYLPSYRPFFLEHLVSGKWKMDLGRRPIVPSGKKSDRTSARFFSEFGRGEAGAELRLARENRRRTII
jgi:Bacterial extracellular solute-binding protein